MWLNWFLAACNLAVVPAIFRATRQAAYGPAFTLLLAAIGAAGYHLADRTHQLHGLPRFSQNEREWLIVDRLATAHAMLVLAYYYRQTMNIDHWLKIIACFLILGISELQGNIFAFVFLHGAWHILIFWVAYKIV